MVISPGHCKTDMGGPNAPNTAEQGVDVIVWLIRDVTFTRNDDINGQFFYQRKKIEF